MLPIRTLRSSRLVPYGRLFTTSAHLSKDVPRAPSIRDLTQSDVDSFNARQKEFRDNIDAARRQREELDDKNATPSSPEVAQAATSPAAPGVGDGPARPSTFASTAVPPTGATGTTTTAWPPSNLPHGLDAASSNLDPSALDSLSSHRVIESHKREPPAKPQKRGPLSSLIYGTKEGQQLDRDIQRSFSQVLARGKYVHSIVFHEVKPDKVDEYTQLVGEWYPKMASLEGNHVHLVGSWRTQVGDNDTFVHIWEYNGYPGYHESLHAIGNHPEFPSFDSKLKKLINSKHTSLMQEFSFWPTTPPRRLGGIFELRSYTLFPGNLLEWETHWRQGLAARREVMEGVGAWFVQIGDLNTVHHLWQFANLEERKLRREKSWSIAGWAETTHKTVPLIQDMKSRILVPMPWSPVG